MVQVYIYILTARVDVNNISSVYCIMYIHYKDQKNHIEQNEFLGEVFVRRFPLRFDLVPLTPRRVTTSAFLHHYRSGLG